MKRIDKTLILTIGIVTCIITLLVGVLIGYFFKFDWTAVSLVITNIIVIAIFVTTFLVIDSTNIKKEENKRKVARRMLNESFLKCEEIIYQPITPIGEKIIEGYKTGKNNKKTPLEFWGNPFVFDEKIYKLTLEGIVDESDFIKYNELKDNYNKYLDFKTYVLVEEIENPFEQMLIENIDDYKLKNNIKSSETIVIHKKIFKEYKQEK